MSRACSPQRFTLSLSHLLLAAVLTLTSVQARLKCWSSDCVDGSDWCIQTCNITLQRSCLAQYRHNTAGQNVASYFGCHSALCNVDQCVPTEGVASDFSCCCAGDLCNSIPYFTPDGDVITAPTPTDELPSIDPRDDTLVCEVYDCGENPDNCYHGYQICPTNETSYCYAGYEYSEETAQYHLSKKECTIDTSGWCLTHICRVDTSGTDTVEFCCCNRDLCNQGIIFTNPDNVDMMIDDPCEDMNCNHSCIVHDGTPHCYCDFGHILSDDQRTCVDLDECALYEGGNCEDHCVNEIGTGYHCGCPDNQRLSDDGFSCEETGLICHNLTCNNAGIGCNDGVVNQYCDRDDEGSPVAPSRQHCQATYKKIGNVYEPRLLGCFNSRDLTCLDDSKCILEQTREGDFYHCCCKENYCNALESVVTPVPESTTTSVVAQPTVIVDSSVLVEPTHTTMTSTASRSIAATFLPPKPTESDGGISQSKLIFIVVVVVAVVLLIPTIAVAIGCISYMSCIGNRKGLVTIDLPEAERQLITSDVSFCNLSFIDKVGQGRFAAVWRAKNIEAEVAVKVFPNTQMSRDSWFRECEIYKTSELEHKYILSFRGSEERETELWIVTDYYALGSLHDLLKKQTLSLKQFCDLAESAAVGLAHLHDQRIVEGVTKKPSIAHRDLKSKNILIRNDFTCVISDFGLAIKFQNEETSSDAHGQVGTSRYMAPEVLEGAISFQREAYLRIDVYAFALILWELASRTSITNGSVKQYHPPFEEYVSPNPSIEEMRDVVVGQLKRPTIAKGFTTSADYDCLRDTIEESWDQDPEARLSAQCIAERIRTFKLSKFVSKDSVFTDTNSPGELTYNSDSIDSQLAPTTPSLSSSKTMSPMTSKTCMLDSGTESIGLYPGHAFSNETVRLGNMSSNSSFLPFGNRSSTTFDSSHNFGGSTIRFNHLQSSGTKYSLHSTETTV